MGRRGDGGSPRSSRGAAKLWMAVDALTILLVAGFATLFELHTGPVAGAQRVLAWHPDLWPLHGNSVGFVVWLHCHAHRHQPAAAPLYAYAADQLLNEQRLSLQACFTSGLLLTGALYLIHAEDIPRSIVLITVGAVAILLSVRRFLYRISLYRRFDRGLGTRNVLIVGTGPEAHAAPSSSGEHQAPRLYL